MKILDANKIGHVAEYINENTKKGADMKLSTDIFSIYAFSKLKDTLLENRSTKILFNRPAFINANDIPQKDMKEFQLRMDDVERNLSENSLELELKNNLDQNYLSVTCSNWIKNNVEVRSITQKGIMTNNFLNKNTDGSGYLMSGNIGLSTEGLGFTNKMNFAVNTVSEQKEIIDGYNMMFDNIWNNKELTKDVKAKLLKDLENLYKENSPELVYYFTLYNLFSNDLSKIDESTNLNERSGIKDTKIWNMLYNFQVDAVVGAINRLQMYNGCIIADSVGLGKTFEALAVIKYYELLNRNVLVFCPKKLRHNWEGFKHNYHTNPLAEERFRFDILSHTDLSRTKGKSGELDLEKLNKGNYDLIVIDESHNFRNNDAREDHVSRYERLMKEFIKAGIRSKVLLLSATPVNNRLKDLKNQLLLITEGDDKALNEHIGINGIESTLRKAQATFNEWNKEDVNKRKASDLLAKLDYDFFKILSSMTIARSRRHITKFYDTQAVGQFPERLTPKSIKSDVDLYGNFPPINEVNATIASLDLAIYTPLLYVFPNKIAEYEAMYDKSVKNGKSVFKQADRDKNIVNLMRVNLLKRMESSVHSFKLTLEKLLAKTNQVLNSIDNMKGSLDAFDIDEDEEETNIVDDIEIGTTVKVKLSDIDTIRYKRSLEKDRDKLQSIYESCLPIDPSIDAKLLALKEEIKNKVSNPINGTNKKIIIFTAFSDTADYIYENLKSELGSKHNLVTALITGSRQECTLSTIKGFGDILSNFSPTSQKFNSDREVDILIATDCISEGQNLQDCDYLINYDIHWNPVRIIQRFGRIDRIGSKNTKIQLVNFWPNLDLDTYINLESRVKGRMVLLDASAAGGDNVLTTEQQDLEYRKKQLELLQKEVLDVEDISGGVSLTDLNLDEFIMNLKSFMKNNPNVLEKTPTGVYAITNVKEKIKDTACEGTIFCFKQKTYEDSKVGSNALYPHHLIYVSKDNELFISNTSPKKVLDIYKSLCDKESNVNEILVAHFNKITKNGSDMSRYTSMLKTATNEILGIEEANAVKSMFGLGAVAKQSNKAALKDLELISFMVIDNGQA